MVGLMTLSTGLIGPGTDVSTLEILRVRVDHSLAQLCTVTAKAHIPLRMAGLTRLQIPPCFGGVLAGPREGLAPCTVRQMGFDPHASSREPVMAGGAVLARHDSDSRSAGYPAP